MLHIILSASEMNRYHFIFDTALIHHRKFRLPCLGNTTEDARAVLYIQVCAVQFCVQRMVCLPVFGILTCTQMLMHVFAQMGCANTTRTPAIKVDAERKNPL